MDVSCFIVTGGAGFIGSHLVDKLVSSGYRVVVIDNLSSGNIKNIETWINHPRFLFVKADLSEPGDWVRVFKDCDVVFHLASNPEVRISTTLPAVHFKNNLQATFNVLEASRLNEIKTLVYASSSTVYGEAKILPTPEDYWPMEPISIYGSFKLAGEVMLATYSRLYGLKSLSLRFANVVGPRSNHGVIYDFINKLRTNSSRLEILGDGTQRKSYVYIHDAITAIIQTTEYLLENDILTDVFNIGSYDTITVKEIADIVTKVLGLREVEYVYRQATKDGRGWLGDVKTMHLDITKIEKKTGWKPTMSSKDAIEKTAKYIAQGVIETK